MLGYTIENAIFALHNIIKRSHEYISKVISFVLGCTGVASESGSPFYAEGEHSARGALVSLEVY